MISTLAAVVCMWLSDEHISVRIVTVLFTMLVILRHTANICRVLIVTDGFLYLSGMLETLKKSLKNAGIGYTIYDEVTRNPTTFEQSNEYSGKAAWNPGADILKLEKFADKEANPLYPVPRLMNARELERFYYDVMEETK